MNLPLHLLALEDDCNHDCNHDLLGFSSSLSPAAPQTAVSLDSTTFTIPDWQKESLSLLATLPGGVQPVGLAFLSSSSSSSSSSTSHPDSNRLRAFLQSFLATAGNLMYPSQQQLVIGISPDADSVKDPKKSSWWRLSSWKEKGDSWTLEEFKVRWKPDDFWMDDSQMAVFKVTHRISGIVRKSAKDLGQLDAVTTKLLSADTLVHLGALGKVVSEETEGNIREKCSTLRGDSDSGKRGGKKAAEARRPYALEGEILQRATNAGPRSREAVSVEIEPNGMDLVEFSIPLDVVTYVGWDQSLSVAARRIKIALANQLRYIAKTLSQDIGGPSVPTPFHFRVNKVAHLITAVYPIVEGQSDEDSLRPLRRSLHQRFRIPEDRPAFRTRNAFDFMISPDQRLRNPHLSLGPSQVADGKKYLVQGDLLYYHYMQDGFDDKGWGCSYRSLQTLCSWFLLQNFTSLPVPSHQQIQSTLVKLGDKEPSFAGSKKWIGSFELSLIFDTLYGVQCKIIHMSSGLEFPSKARELAFHFETQGTPVMIGGGVLAYTLLGIDYCEVTDNVNWLILDPHYTGGEDLKVVLEKGWCAWKSSDLFRADAFYNLCLPQRPRSM